MTTTAAPRFSVDVWAAFWADPLAPQEGGNVLDADIVGYWPDEPEPVHGLADYTAKIGGLLRQVPDLTLEVVDHATNDDLIFIHYVGRGTGADGPFELRGIDRIRVRDGLVVENVIRYDHTQLRNAVQGTQRAG